MNSSGSLIIYADGSAQPTNPGPGGWGFVVLPSDLTLNTEYRGSGAEEKSTNNRMELTAVIEALNFASGWFPESDVHFFCDSMYVINCATGKWKRSKNTDLWTLYDEAVGQSRKVSYTWVKGHSGDKWNDIADELASTASVEK